MTSQWAKKGNEGRKVCNYVLRQCVWFYCSLFVREIQESTLLASRRIDACSARLMIMLIMHRNWTSHFFFVAKNSWPVQQWFSGQFLGPACRLAWTWSSHYHADERQLWTTMISIRMIDRTTLIIEETCAIRTFSSVLFRSWRCRKASSR